MEAQAPAKPSFIGFDHYQGGLKENVKNNLRFTYVDFSSLETHDLSPYEQKEALGTLPSRGIYAIPELFKEIGYIIFHLVKLAFWDTTYSLYTWNSDYLLAAAFQIARDGEAFFGTCLLVANYVSGHLYIEHASLHREAYQTYLDFQIVKETMEILTDRQKVFDSVNLDFNSYAKIRDACFESKDYDLLFDITGYYQDLFTNMNHRDKIYYDMATLLLNLNPDDSDLHQKLAKQVPKKIHSNDLHNKILQRLKELE